MSIGHEWILPEDRKSWVLYTPGPVETIPTLPFEPKLKMVRLDLLKSWATGNKYFKLKYAIQYAITQGITSIVSKGGMFSNHLLASAEACDTFKIKFIALIRSYSPDELNPTICRLRALNTEIVYLQPLSYNDFGDAAAASAYPSALFIQEGGLSEWGIQGASEIMQECIPYHPTHIILAGGSMGTACGILSAAPSTIKVVIVPCWKGYTDKYFKEILSTYHIRPDGAWEIWPDYHFGGFGKFNQQLIDFMFSFSGETDIPLDPVYTGKVMFGVYDKMKSGYFTKDDSLLVLHTGGLQGLSGFKYRFPKAWGDYLNHISIS